MTPYVLKRTDIEALPGTDKRHFRNPEAMRNNKSLGDLTGLTGIGVHLITVPCGHDSTEYHVHHHEDECAYVLSGSGTVTIDERTHAIATGDFIGYRKGGSAHTMTNTGDEPLVCLVIGERLAHDVADYPRQGKRIYRQAGLPYDLVDHDAIEHPSLGDK